MHIGSVQVDHPRSLHPNLVLKMRCLGTTVFLGNRAPGAWQSFPLRLFPFEQVGEGFLHFIFYCISMFIIDFGEVFIFKCRLFFLCFWKTTVSPSQWRPRMKATSWVLKVSRLLPILTFWVRSLYLCNRESNNLLSCRTRSIFGNGDKGCPPDDFPMPTTHVVLQLGKNFHYRNQVALAIDKIGCHISSYPQQ